MKEKYDYHKLLNGLLDYVIDKENNTQEDYVIRVPFSNKEDVLYEKLLRDKYIYVYGNEHRATVEGRMFYENGGYVQKQKTDKTELKFKNWTTYALIFGGVAGGIYYSFELLKMLCSVYSYFFYHCYH